MEFGVILSCREIKESLSPPIFSKHFQMKLWRKRFTAFGLSGWQTRVVKSK
jgi:hypothetical protein